MLSDAFIELVATANPAVLNTRISARKTLGQLLKEKGVQLHQIADLTAEQIETFLGCETPQVVVDADLLVRTREEMEGGEFAVEDFSNLNEEDSEEEADNAFADEDYIDWKD